MRGNIRKCDVRSSYWTKQFWANGDLDHTLAMVILPCSICGWMFCSPYLYQLWKKFIKRNWMQSIIIHVSWSLILDIFPILLQRHYWEWGCDCVIISGYATSSCVMSLPAKVDSRISDIWNWKSEASFWWNVWWWAAILDLWRNFPSREFTFGHVRSLPVASFRK